MVTYTHTPNIVNVHAHVTQRWQDAAWPVLLILIDVAGSKKFSSAKEFNNMQMSVFDAVAARNYVSPLPFPGRLKEPAGIRGNCEL